MNAGEYCFATLPPDHPLPLTACIATLDTAEQRLQAGNVLTGSMTELRDEVDAIVALFSAMESAEN